MSPLQTLSRLLKVDPKTGTFILTGLALLAASAMALAFGSDIDDAVVLAVYILAFALAVTVLAFISRQETMRTTISWIAIAAFGGWVVGLFGSVLRMPPTLPQLPCYIRLPIELPAVCEARLTTTTIVIGNADQTWLWTPTGGPDQIWTVENHIIAPPAEMIVVLQFTDTVSRDATITLTTALTGLGWTVSDGTAGGEQVSSGPDQNEVRYFRPEDSAAAIQLAEAIYAQNPTAPITVRDFTRLGSYAQTGLLEVWLNNLPNGVSG